MVKKKPVSWVRGFGFFYLKITRNALFLRTIFILEVYAYLVVAVTLKNLVQPCWFIRK